MSLILAIFYELSAGSEHIGIFGSIDSMKEAFEKNRMIKMEKFPE